MELPAQTMRITPEAVQAYAEITDDFNPIHLDADFAAASPMRGIVAHGTLSLGLLWQALSLVHVGAPAWSLDIRFVRPVRLGDEITAGGAAAADGTLAVWVRNQRGEDVIAGTALRNTAGG